MTTNSLSKIALSEKQLVVFGLAGETYGVDISMVREIIQMQEITSVPGTANSVKGVTNLRGTVIPVVDLAKRFGLAEVKHSKNTRIVVINSKGNPIGVIVDSVNEVLRVSSESIEPPSQMLVTSRSEYLLGIAKVAEKLVILLDADKVLSGDYYAQLLPVGKEPSAAKVEAKEEAKVEARVEARVEAKEEAMVEAKEEAMVVEAKEESKVEAKVEARKKPR